MFDYRYPHLVRVENAPHGVRKEAVRMGKAIERRAYCDVCYDERRESLFVFSGDPVKGLHSIRLRNRDGARAYWSEDAEVDEACRVVARVRRPAREKLAAVAGAEKSEKSSKDDAIASSVSDMMPDVAKSMERHAWRD